MPREPAGGRHILFEQFWVEYGDKTIDNCEDDSFILTKSVRANLKNLARAVVLRYWIWSLGGFNYGIYEGLLICRNSNMPIFMWFSQEIPRPPPGTNIQRKDVHGVLFGKENRPHSHKDQQP